MTPKQPAPHHMRLLRELTAEERKRFEIFETLDLRRFRLALLADAEHDPSLAGVKDADDETLYAAMHKARVMSMHIDGRKQHVSRQWLRERGYRIPGEGAV